MNLNETVQQPGYAKSASMAQMQRLVSAHADLLFPKRTASSAFMKLFEELGEVIKDPTNALEWADVFILCLDLAEMHGVNDLASAIIAKMVDNRAREWRETSTGTFQHVPGSGQATSASTEPVETYGGLPC